MASATASAKRSSSCSGVSCSSQAGFIAATIPETVIDDTSPISDSEMVWPLSLASTPWTMRSSIAAAAAALPARSSP